VLITHPMALTVLLWPEYRAEAELALSVMKLSMECDCHPLLVNGPWLRWQYRTLPSDVQ
jgi:hypothetical protein